MAENKLSLDKPFNAADHINIAHIDDVDHYNDEASELLTAYLELFTEQNGLIRPIKEQEKEEWEQDIDFIYTWKGQNLAEKAIDSLYAFGGKYFYSDDLEISSMIYFEP